MTAVRVEVVLQGIVQGVGMRPHLWRVARAYELTGLIRNEAGAVRCEFQGPGAAIEGFLDRLPHDLPSRAVLSGMDVRFVPPRRPDTSLEITASDPEASAGTGSIPPDIATCGPCLAEMRDPADRRYRYPFITCATCGPRHTIARRVPWDRANTTMDVFGMCAACRDEYNDPRTRRYHAETISCHDCGPTLSLRAGTAAAIRGDLACLAAAARVLAAGELLAAKGIGGYHLMCRADSDAVVQHLRTVKGRPDKPFAIMVRDLAAAREFGDVDAGPASAGLAGWRAPIVLVPRRGAGRLSPRVAPRLANLGIMLPYTALHHLLLAELGDDVPALVVTSANRNSAPIIADDADAHLPGLCDAVLAHNRVIVNPTDDSVVFPGVPHGTVVRLGRGFLPLELPAHPGGGTDRLALGGDLKCVLATRRAGKIVVGPRLGTLRGNADRTRLDSAVDRLRTVSGLSVGSIVVDAHPGYVTRLWALAQPAEQRIRTVDHHLAHVAAVLAEHAVPDRRAIGVAFDGFGFDADHERMAGGEFFLTRRDQAGWLDGDRVGSLRPYRLPRTDAIARRPAWVAVALLDQLDVEVPDHLVTEPIALAGLQAVMRNPGRTVTSSSVGRLFDAVAAILAVCLHASYEGQAAVELEALAGRVDDRGRYPYRLVDESGGLVVDFHPTVRGVAADSAAGADPARIARRFHNTVAEWTVAACDAIRTRSGADPAAVMAVALGGGVFTNQLLAARVSADLSSAGFRPLRGVRLPPNDEALAVGQLSIRGHRHPTAI